MQSGNLQENTVIRLQIQGVDAMSWWVKKAGTDVTSECQDFTLIQKAIDKNRLGPNDLISSSPFGPWKPLRSIDQLRFDKSHEQGSTPRPQRRGGSDTTVDPKIDGPHATKSGKLSIALIAMAGVAVIAGVSFIVVHRMVRQAEATARISEAIAAAEKWFADGSTSSPDEIIESLEIASTEPLGADRAQCLEMISKIENRLKEIEKEERERESNKKIAEAVWQQIQACLADQQIDLVQLLDLLGQYISLPENAHVQEAQKLLLQAEAVGNRELIDQILKSIDFQSILPFLGNQEGVEALRQSILDKLNEEQKLEQHFSNPELKNLFITKLVAELDAAVATLRDEARKKQVEDMERFDYKNAELVDGTYLSKFPEEFIGRFLILDTNFGPADFKKFAFQTSHGANIDTWLSGSLWDQTPDIVIINNTEFKGILFSPQLGRKLIKEHPTSSNIIDGKNGVRVYILVVKIEGKGIFGLVKGMKVMNPEDIIAKRPPFTTPLWDLEDDVWW